MPSFENSAAATLGEMAPLTTLPRSLLTVLVLLCRIMMVEILLMPASWLLGVLPASFIRLWTPAFGVVIRVMPVPLDIVSKYAGQTAVVLLHQLSCAGWCMIIPMQLDDRLRARRPRLHRACGMTVVLLSILISCGVALMDRRGLYFSHAPAVVVFLRAATLWFLASGLLAAGAALSARIASHHAWVMRHVAAGLWVAVQRILVTLALPITYVLRIPYQANEELRAWIFGTCSAVAFITSLLVCEWHLASRRGGRSKVT